MAMIPVEIGVRLGLVEYADNQYEIHFSKCEKAIFYKRVKHGFWNSTALEHLSKTSNSFCRDAWKLIERAQDPSVSPKCKVG